MGVSIYCGKLNMDMSYSTFDRWRVSLAQELNKEFGAVYKDWLFSMYLGENDKTLICQSLNLLIEKTPELTPELKEFFLASDCDGEINFEVSKQLLPLISRLDDEYLLGYIGVCPYSKDFVLDFFKHSVRYRAKVKWC